MPLVQPCCLLKKKGWGDLKFVGSVTVSEADALRDMHIHTTRPLRYISAYVQEAYVKGCSQFKSLVFEDFDITFHN
jgi:hypothetical protein